jgi:hypothetical protein
LANNINAIKKNTKALTDASKKIGLDVNTEKTKYMLMSCHQNAGQNHNRKIGNRSFEKVAKFRYLEMIVTNQNLIHEGIQGSLNFGMVLYHSNQKLLNSHLLAKNIKIRMYETIIFPVALYGCETWALTLRQEYRQRYLRTGC